MYTTPPAQGSAGPATPPPQIAEPATSNYTPYPGPAEGAALTAPPLLAPPHTDATASRPTVDIHTAVYRRPVSAATVSTTAARPAAAVDASGWETVPPLVITIFSRF